MFCFIICYNTQEVRIYASVILSLLCYTWKLNTALIYRCIFAHKTTLILHFLIITSQLDKEIHLFLNMLFCNVRKAMAETTKPYKQPQGPKSHVSVPLPSPLSCLNLLFCSWSYKVIPVMVEGVNNDKNIRRWVGGRLIRSCSSLISACVHVVDVDCHHFCVNFLKDSVEKNSRS